VLAPDLLADGGGFFDGSEFSLLNDGDFKQKAEGWEVSLAKLGE